VETLAHSIAKQGWGFVPDGAGTWNGHALTKIRGPAGGTVVTGEKLMLTLGTGTSGAGAWWKHFRPAVAVTT
jgi:hypothetical protein